MKYYTRYCLLGICGRKAGGNVAKIRKKNGQMDLFFKMQSKDKLFSFFIIITLSFLLQFSLFPLYIYIFTFFAYHRRPSFHYFGLSSLHIHILCLIPFYLFIFIILSFRSNIKHFTTSRNLKKAKKKLHRKIFHPQFI